MPSGSINSDSLMPLVCHSSGSYGTSCEEDYVSKDEKGFGRMISQLLAKMGVSTSAQDKWKQEIAAKNYTVVDTAAETAKTNLKELKSELKRQSVLLESETETGLSFKVYEKANAGEEFAKTLSLGYSGTSWSLRVTSGDAPHLKYDGDFSTVEAPILAIVEGNDSRFCASF